MSIPSATAMVPFENTDEMTQHFLLGTSPIEELSPKGFDSSHIASFVNLFSGLVNIHARNEEHLSKKFTVVVLDHPDRVDLQKTTEQAVDVVSRIHTSVKCLTLVFEYLTPPDPVVGHVRAAVFEPMRGSSDRHAFNKCLSIVFDYLGSPSFADKQRTELLMMKDLVIDAIAIEIELHKNADIKLLGGSRAFFPHKYLPTAPLGWSTITRAVTAATKVLSQVTHISIPDYSQMTEEEAEKTLKQVERTELEHMDKVVEKEKKAQDWLDHPAMHQAKNKVCFEIGDSILYDLLGEMSLEFQAIQAKKDTRKAAREAKAAQEKSDAFFASSMGPKPVFKK